MEKLTITIDVDSTTGEARVRGMNSTVDKLRHSVNKPPAAGNFFDRMTQSVMRSSSGLEALQRNALGLAAAGSLVLLARQATNAASEYELAHISFTTMLGSADKATAYLKQLADFAARTPFELKGLIDNARYLKGMGVELDRARRWCRRADNSTRPPGHRRRAGRPGGHRDPEQRPRGAGRLPAGQPRQLRPAGRRGAAGQPGGGDGVAVRRAGG